MMGRKLKTKRGTDTSARDLLKNWNEYYINNDFGIGVQCCECQKWRMTYLYQESKEVPKDWTCSMWEVQGKNRIGNCSIPSNLTEADFALEEYPPGTVVWAKQRGYNWWPAMIEDSPDNQEFFMIDENGHDMYHVNFFGGRPLRSWVKASHIKEFDTPPTDPQSNSKRVKISLSRKKAIEQAEKASKISIKERLKKYSFAVRYQGRWAKIKNKDKISLPPICQKVKGLAKNTRKRPAKGTPPEAPLRKKILHLSKWTNEEKREPEEEQPSTSRDENYVARKDICVKKEPEDKEHQWYANQPQEEQPAPCQSENKEVCVKKEPEDKEDQQWHVNQNGTTHLPVFLKRYPKFRKDTGRNGFHLIKIADGNEEAELKDGASTGGLVLSPTVSDVSTVVVVSSDNEDVASERVLSSNVSDSALPSERLSSPTSSDVPTVAVVSSDSEDEEYSPEQLAYMEFLKKKFPSFIKAANTAAVSNAEEHIVTT